ncbi:prephenate dehydrogenase [Aestuariimicrobium soli]|uniref:prephenate dehydrogenase n=1 Tax=Aestuariimicrobium soli TaxID=2035834 RepID=UPI003EB7235F
MSTREGAGLAFPDDLAAWQRWAERRHGVQGALRRAKGTLRPSEPATATLWLPPDEPTTLVVMDNLSPSCRLVIHEPLRHAADLRRVAVLTEVPDPLLPEFGDGAQWSPVEFIGPGQLPRSIERVLSLGAFNRLSAVVEGWAKPRDKQFVVVQHGLMTPWAPPLNDGDHLLAWSEADAHFWSADRDSITWQVVGPQMLWEAAGRPAAEVVDDRPVMLGQLHGIELPRLQKVRVYESFCLRQGADYRPHPIERDVASRAAHAWLQRRGVGFETSGRPLVDLGRPVVSIFSTGTLEAAQRGLPAWVHHPSPPAWVRDFWARYGLREFGDEPTAAWSMGADEPAALIARAVGL